MRVRWLRWFGLISLVAVLGSFSARILWGVQPTVEFYTADRLAVDYMGVEAGLEAVNMTWKAVNVGDEHFMRMEAWVGGRWVLIGEHFAAEKTDRIVVSHPLSFANPLYRLRILNDGGEVIDERRLELRYARAETTPEIAQFIAPVRGGVAADGLSVGEVVVPIVWRVENRSQRQQPVIEQVVMPSGDVIGTLLNNLQIWLPREGERDLALAPTEADTVFIRLRVVDTVTNATLTENIITLPVVENTNGSETIRSMPAPDVETLEHARVIYAEGQAQGNTPNRLMRIGDSNIAGDSALCNFGTGNYDLGSYTHLQTTIDRFKDSFCEESAAAGASFSTTSLLDPMWTRAESCHANETPLDCAIREERPTYAVIYIGVQDVDRLSWNPTLTPENYRENLSEIVAILTGQGVVPILSTFPTGYTFHNDGSAERLNGMIRQIADEQHVPVIDLRADTALYPNRGVDVDGFHMSTPPGGKTSFTGNEALYARTLYELRVLEALTQLDEVVAGGASRSGS